MIAPEGVRAIGRKALRAAYVPVDLLPECHAALARPGRLFSATPIASRLFLAWSGALLPAVPAAWSAAVAACEYVLAGCDLIDRHTDALCAGGSRQHMAGGQTEPLSAGICLLLLAQELMSELDAPEERRTLAARALGRMSRRALAAHRRDGLLRTCTEVRPEMALAILRQRSGELVALPCVCAALLAGAGPRVAALARRFGRALGCAGQLEDDLADRTEDLATGRKTLPRLLAEREPDDLELATAVTAVLTHRYLEEAAGVLRSLSTSALYDSEALWDLLPGELRSRSHCSPARVSAFS